MPCAADLTIRSSRDRFAAAELFVTLSQRRGRKALRLNSGVRPNQTMRRTTLVILFIISALLAAAGYAVDAADNHRFASFAKVDGHVVSYRTQWTGGRRSRHEIYFPSVTFTSKEGREHAFESRVALRSMRYTIGQRVTVLYDQSLDSPSADAEIQGQGLRFSLALYYLAFCFGLIGAIGAYRLKRLA